jgi:DNA-binding GntR family transcriptional regulator
MSDIEEVEVSIEEVKKLVERKNAAKKLASNREFRKLILEGYFVDEAARLAGLSADPLHEKHRGEIILGIQGISLLRQYLQTIIRMGDIAEAELKEHQETLDELREMDGEAA